MINMINWLDVLVWGPIATGMMVTIEAAGVWLGLTRVSIPLLLGTIFTPQRDVAGVIGFVIHMIVGLLFAFGYAFAFESMGRATWWLGGGLAILHSAFALGAAAPLLPGIHPRMAGETHGPTPTRSLQPPGFFALNYGRRTFIVTTSAHVVYGVILGAGYTPQG